jgi:hypothetical protein
MIQRVDCLSTGLHTIISCYGSKSTTLLPGMLSLRCLPSKSWQSAFLALFAQQVMAISYGFCFMTTSTRLSSFAGAVLAPLQANHFVRQHAHHDPSFITTWLNHIVYKPYRYYTDGIKTQRVYTVPEEGPSLCQRPPLGHPQAA